MKILNLIIACATLILIMDLAGKLRDVYRQTESQTSGALEHVAKHYAAIDAVMNWK